jgi:eukaryotic-like serine/threonine-protein kinase
MRQVVSSLLSSSPFYYRLTGIPPYPGGDITDKLTRHAQSAPPDVRDLRPNVPEALAQVMLRMMAKRPEDRFASFDDARRASHRCPLQPGSLCALPSERRSSSR